MIKVLVLGSKGMLGSMVHRVLSHSMDIKVMGTSRSTEDTHHSGPGWRLPFRAEDPATLLRTLPLYGGWPDFIINCIGRIKPTIDDLDPESVAKAIEANAVLPHRLAGMAADLSTCRIIHITTDCVFSGLVGGYTESALHDADDHYGKTKSLGEVVADNTMNLRCSIIGPELSRPTRSLLEWVIGQKMGANILGYSNHFWSGLTTLHFAHICQGLVTHDHLFRAGTQHLVPQDMATKFSLLQWIARAWGREDMTVEAIAHSQDLNMTLNTRFPDQNAALWNVSGYPVPPTIDQMVRELAEFCGVPPLGFPA